MSSRGVHEEADKILFGGPKISRMDRVREKTWNLWRVERNREYFKTGKNFSESLNFEKTLVDSSVIRDGGDLLILGMSETVNLS